MVRVGGNVKCYSPKTGMKKRYPDEASALGAAKGNSKRLGIKMKPYFCEWCGFWHIGHE